MNSKPWSVAVFLLSTIIPAQAQIELNTSINDVDYRGPHELVGSISFAVIGDDIPDATVENPVYLNVRFSQGALLAETLVNLASQDANLNQPIFVPLNLDTNSADVTMAASPSAISIVRWVAGEKDVWIRIIEPTNTWLTQNDTPIAPSEEHRVSFDLGMSARGAAFRAENYQEDRRNLPFPSQVTETTLDQVENARSILFCLDLTKSEISGEANLASLLNFDIGAYASDAAGPDGTFSSDNTALPIDFIGEYRIARGKVREVRITESSNPIDFQMQFPKDQPADDFFTAVGITKFELLGESANNNVLPAELLPGATLELETADDLYGFDEDSVTFEGVDSSFVPDPESAFEISGRTLYRRGVLTWQDSTENLGLHDVIVSAQMVLPFNDLVSSIRLNYEWKLVSHDGPQDQAPFDGPGQNRRCDAYSWTAATGTWTVANIIPALAASAVIPHVTQAGGDFLTVATLINPSAEQQDYRLTGYDETGQQVATMSGSLAAGASLSQEVHALMENDAITHMGLASGTPILLSAAYRAVRGGATAQSHSSRVWKPRWLLFPGDWSLGFDGLAVVNMGVRDTPVQIHAYDADGAILESRIIAETLTPTAKKLYVINTAFETTGVYFEIEAEQPIIVVALRGDSDSFYLWQNPLIPMD